MEEKRQFSAFVANKEEVTSVKLNRIELKLLHNALYEACNRATSESDFKAQFGCTPEEARQLLTRIRAIYVSPSGK